MRLVRLWQNWVVLLVGVVVWYSAADLRAELRGFLWHLLKDAMSALT